MTARKHQTAWAAARDFLRGFVGVATGGIDCNSDSGRSAVHRAGVRETPAEVRATLAARAANRKSCC
jgi:hypothetical protein